MADEGSLNVRIEGENGSQIKRYNPDGIVYLGTARRTLKTPAWAIIFLPFLFSIILTIVIESAWLLIVGFLGSAILFVFLQKSPGLTISTLTNTESLRSEDAGEISTRFAELVPQHLYTSGTVSLPLHDEQYVYYVNPNNVVSLGTQRAPDVRYKYAVLVGTVVFVATYLGVSDPNLAASLGAVLSIGAALGIFKWMSAPSHIVELDLQNGEQKVFYLSAKDASKLVTEFSESQ